jgi:hypothetical protein
VQFPNKCASRFSPNALLQIINILAKVLAARFLDLCESLLQLCQLRAALRADKPRN